jgi:pimeloyl-ACP methyl ester carboxylesterase
MSTIVEPQDRIVDVDGLTMHYLDWGNTAKPTIVLLHGLRGHAHSWDDVSAALSPDFHVLALDQRGRGMTDWAKDGDYGIDAFVGDLVGFCRVLGLEKFILMGHSMGARNAMAFADKHAHRLEKLVLSEFGPQINPKGGQRIAQELIDVPEEFDTLDDAIAYMAQFNRYASAAVMHRREFYSSKELPNGRIGWRYDLEIRAARRRGDPIVALDLWPALPKIACPTLVVRATETDVLDLDVAQRMIETLPDGRLVEIERAEHMVFEDNPEDFIAAVRAFLV